MSNSIQYKIIFFQDIEIVFILKNGMYLVNDFTLRVLWPLWSEKLIKIFSTIKEGEQ